MHEWNGHVGRRAFLQGALSLAASAAVPASAMDAMPTVRASGRILRVGRNKDFETPIDACVRLRNGDTIEIDADTYVNGLIGIPEGVNNITIRGVGAPGARAVLTHVRGQEGVRPAQFPYRVNGFVRPGVFNTMGGKGICVVDGNDVLLENLEFSGATSSSSNGAGVRAEGVNLTMRNVVSHHNQMGLLGNAQPESTVAIIDCEFYEQRGGPSIDQGHNIYFNPIKKLIVRGTKSHHCHVGHLLKTRARGTIIENCEFYDGDDGNSSMALDISGGIAIVAHNKFQKGPRSDNPNNMIHFYTSRDPAGPHVLNVIDNEFECLLPTNGYWVRIRNDHASKPPIAGSIKRNIFRAKYAADIGPNGGVYPKHYNHRPVPDLGSPPVANAVIEASDNSKVYVGEGPPAGRE